MIIIAVSCYVFSVLTFFPKDIDKFRTDDTTRRTTCTNTKAWDIPNNPEDVLIT